MSWNEKGEDVLTHEYVTSEDPPGTENRRWRCQHCRALGTLRELAKARCPRARSSSDDDLLDAIDTGRGN